MAMNFGYNNGRDYIGSAQYQRDMLSKAYPDLTSRQLLILLNSGFFNDPNQYYAKSRYAPWEQLNKYYR